MNQEPEPLDGEVVEQAKRKSRHKADLERIQPLKDEYLRFYERFPLQSAAADYIGRSRDTIQLWQKNDPEFKTAVDRAKAIWTEKNHKRIKPDNMLMYLYPELRPPKQEIEHSGEGLKNTVIYLPDNGRNTDSATTSDPEPAPSGD